MLWLALLGCRGPQFLFLITSPDVPIAGGDFVVYRIEEVDGDGWHAGMTGADCDGDRCVVAGPDNDIADGAQILVWLDVDGDDHDEWEAEGVAEGTFDVSRLRPDPVDPRDLFLWSDQLGRRDLEAELRLPE